MDDKTLMLEKLQAVITHFSQDPPALRSKNDTICTYLPPADKPKSIGCAIGMFLAKEASKVLDGVGYKSITNILSYEPHKVEVLPEWLKTMNLNFLEELQKLHDKDVNWTNFDISEYGKDKVSGMCKAFNLDSEKIKYKTL